jgi:hypothetical protein
MSRPIVTVYPTALREIERANVSVSMLIDAEKRYAAQYNLGEPSIKSDEAGGTSETILFQAAGRTRRNLLDEPLLDRVAVWRNEHGAIATRTANFLISRRGLIDIGYGIDENDQLHYYLMSAGDGGENPDRNDYEM